MSEIKFNPGDVARHVFKRFDHIDLFVVKVLDSGQILCRYLSYHSPGKESNSEYIFQQMEFEAFELVHYEAKPPQELGVYFA